ncbi:S-layer family protein [Calothrix sp. FACHB-1219]|nr:S-layer family protein [Calothrix sp. FACHB-168]MBD2221615.1 S-layer family protein [Calothrix sp. FACHB-1219]
MNHNGWRCQTKLPLIICLTFLKTIIILLTETTSAQSEIVPDDTLGTEKSQIINNFNGVVQEGITGGSVRGMNLFHSFREFNVGEARTVYFANPTGIENILARVTGRNPSEILGKLGVLGNANLFLLNPNGIIFGRDASLDIRGSFVATSANGVKFGEQGLFSASSPQAVPLLTVKPSALFFNQIGAGTIENSSIAPAGVNQVSNPVLGLRVADGNSLLLVGGNVLNAGRLNALGGRVELASVASVGEVGLSIDGKNLALTFPQEVARGDISLRNGAIVNVASDGGGAIALTGNNIDISEGSSLNAGITRGLGTSDTKAGDITLNATQAISLSQSSSVANQVSENTTGISGNINIQAGSLNLTNGSDLIASTFGEGNTGGIFIDVKGAVTLDGEDTNGNPSRIVSQVRESAIGDSGDIKITAESLNLTGGGSLTSSTFGKGNAGRITIDIKGAVNLDGETTNGIVSTIISQVVNSAIGNGGDIEITADSLNLSNGTFVSNSTFGVGNGGSITIDVKGAVKLDGESTNGIPSAIVSNAEQTAIGNGGDINITAESLTLLNGSLFTNSTFGVGNGGSITIDVKDAVKLDGESTNGIPSVIGSQVGWSAIGNGGDINITAGFLTLTQGVALSNLAIGNGNAGSIFIDVKGAVNLDGESRNGIINTTIITQVQETAIGDGGDIKIKAGSLNLFNGSFLSTNIFGQGNAGNIVIDVKGAVNLDGEGINGFSSEITSKAENTAIGNGGNIHLKAESLNLNQGANLSASTLGEGKGGNIQIETSEFVNLSNDSQISVNSRSQGDAGELSIKTNSLTLRGRSRLLADTFSSEGGNIQLQIRDLLLLRDNSRISTTAGQQATGGNGGNIDINTKFLVAVPNENSDITANAFAGKGGLIRINTQGIFGIEKSDSLTQLGDITAFSQQNPQLNGEIIINTPSADISNELVALPTNVVDASRLITQGCSASSVANRKSPSQFIITGRGGIPPQPNHALRVPTIAISANNLTTTQSNQPLPVTAILEANTLSLNDQGQIILSVSSGTDTSNWRTNNDKCQNSS